MVKKTLNRLKWASEEQKKRILGIINGYEKPTNYASVRQWIACCSRIPSRQKQEMCALDEICETFGTETIWCDAFSFVAPIATYLNTGKSYNVTIVYRHDLHRYQVKSRVELVEMFEHQGKRIN